MKTFAAALVALALLPATASAKEGIELSSLPTYLHAGQSWTTDVRELPFPGQARLPRSGVGIQIERGGHAIRFAGRPLTGGGYRVRVAFPSAGRWSYRVVGLGHLHQQNWAPVDVAPAPGGPTASGGSFPYGWVAGGGGALALVLGAVGVSRYRAGRAGPRPGASPSAPAR